MNKQEQYRLKYRKLIPTWEDSPSLYKRLIASQVHPDTHILDIGCGHTSFLADIYSMTPWTYGIDPDPDAIQQNSSIRHTTVGNAEKLPYENEMFDIVVLAWVLEHLDDPETVFREIHRVLKPGGNVIFLTPNTWNYNVWIIRLIPNAFHEFFTRRLYDRREHDTFPTRYRFNSATRIKTVLTRIGFQKDFLYFNGDPSYISFNNALFLVACWIERLLELRVFQCMKVHLVGSYEKRGST